MTKLKQFSNKFDALYSRENNPWTGEYMASQAVKHSSQGILGKSEFYRVLRRQCGNDMIGQEVVGFLEGWQVLFSRVR